ncbi:MAG: hypothetical protein JWN61_3219 [Pseudonocardiales bacterium]|nr:hypothetical protein [Pseudonocardiales bacterium]
MLLQHIERLGVAADAIALATGHGVQREVPSCPGWALADLVRHVGTTHRWAHAIIDGRLDGRPRDMFGLAGQHGAQAAAVADDALPAWFAAGHEALHQALMRTPPDAQFWTFGAGPSPVEFWARRQAHETSMHAIDAQLAVMSPQDVAPVPTWFAIDGIAEMLEVFVARPGAKARSEPARTMLVAPTDHERRWLVTIGPEAVSAEAAPDGATGDGAIADGTTADGTTADATLSGTAHDLYSTLWNRSPIGRVDIVGDPAVARLWADGVRIT